jgi:CRP-like cAMP-binding protein
VEGEPGRDILILISGEADVSRASPGGQRLLNVQAAGAVVGEMAVLDPGPRSATVRVREQGAEVLRLPGSAFRDVVAVDSDIATVVIQTLVRRLRRSELDPTERGGPVSVRA